MHRAVTRAVTRHIAFVVLLIQHWSVLHIPAARVFSACRSRAVHKRAP